MYDIEEIKHELIANYVRESYTEDLVEILEENDGQLPKVQRILDGSVLVEGEITINVYCPLYDLKDIFSNYDVSTSDLEIDGRADEWE